MGRWPVLVAVLLVACGDNRAAIVDAGAPPDAAIDAAEPVYEGPPPEQDVVRSGTRLRARFLRDSRGAREHRGLHDAVRGEDCSWGGDGDGGWACLPEYEPDDLYEDAACLHPVATSDQPCPSRYLTVFDRSREPWRMRAMYELEATYQPAAPLWLPENGTCRPAPARRYRRTVRRVGVDELVRGFEVLAGDGRVQTVTIVGADGSWTPLGNAFDRELGAYCNPSPGVGACVLFSAWTSVYADADCTRPVLIVPVGSPPPLHMTPAGAVVDPVAVYERGAVLAPDNPAVDLHDLVGGECTEHTQEVPLGATLFAAGALVPLDAMAPARLVSSGTLPLDDVRVVAGELEQHQYFRDGARGNRCGLVEDARGGWRCLPSLPYVSILSLDRRCVSKVEMIAGYRDGDEATVAARAVPGACGGVWEAVAIGSAYEFPLYLGTPELCVDIGVPPVPYRRIAGPATFDAFPALEAFTE
jgi:hypothetical protein